MAVIVQMASVRWHASLSDLQDCAGFVAGLQANDRLLCVLTAVSVARHCLRCVLMLLAQLVSNSSSVLAARQSLQV